MKRFTRIALASLSLAAALGLPASPAAAKTEVPLATWGGTDHINIRLFVPELEKAIAAAQPNDIQFKHYPGGQLAQDKDMPVAIPSGQVKFGWITVNGWTGTIPDTRIMDAPTGLNQTQFDKLLDGPTGLMNLLNKEFTKKNSLLLGLCDLGAPAIVSKTPIKSPADFKGKKVRVFSEGLADEVRRFGGSPVKLPFSEVYTALQYGTVDAAITGFQGVDSQKLYEVSKYVLVPASFMGMTMMGWAVNKPWLDSLPANDRTALMKAVDIASHENRKDVLDNIGELTKSYRDRGLTVTFLSPEQPEFKQWETATAPILQNVLKDLSPDTQKMFSKK